MDDVVHLTGGDDARLIEIEARHPLEFHTKAALGGVARWCPTCRADSPCDARYAYDRLKSAESRIRELEDQARVKIQTWPRYEVQEEANG